MTEDKAVADLVDLLLMIERSYLREVIEGSPMAAGSRNNLEMILGLLARRKPTTSIAVAQLLVAADLARRLDPELERQDQPGSFASLLQCAVRAMEAIHGRCIDAASFLNASGF